MNQTAKQPKREVRVFEPDRSLQMKIGATSMEKIFTPDVVSKAQTIIEESSSELLDESITHLELLKKAYAIFTKGAAQEEAMLPIIIDTSFKIKTQTGLGGCLLASSLAESLQNHAEHIQKDGLSENTLEILDWHVTSLEQFIKLRLKGDGGATGKAILNEIARIAPKKT